ncbi:MAG: hypothetical protein J0G96_08375 [Flavobacteriia bacterium]|nr:hypothetical protein [Flavobacteriia bacterium]OJX34926.1 MAG: hypothetical protein BGO87_09300 [Flavobacteriia bacterium 40-80]
MKKLYILFLFIVLSLNGYAQSDTTVTNTAANTSFLDFVKKVYFNPTILLKTQNFKATNNVQIQLLPSNSSQSPQSIKGFELAMQKVIRFILESGSEGIVRYYFNPNFPSTPFSVVYSEELHCKFTSADIDSITNRLNAPFKNTAINYNNSALFEGAIQAGMDYTAQCLRKNPGKCGKKPENLISEINTKPLYITLHNTNGSKYDIDTFRYENYDSYYTQVYDLFTQQNAYVPAKLFVAGGASEPISIAIHKREENVLKQNFKVVYIATKQILELESGSSTDSLKIKLPQNLPANQIAEFGIYYKSTQDSITYLVGSFMVHVYTEKVINLHLVSVDGAAIPQQDIAAALKKMYDPVGVKFNISATKNITANPSWAKDITIESSGLLSSYTKELRDYVSAVKDLNNYDKDDYYIVFGLSCNNSVTGYMPRKSKIGFVFTNTTDAGDVLAHEIGHGAFHLRHIFSDEELGASMQGMTKNLMDYVQNPTDLYVPQWEGIDDPVSVGWFEGDDEEGMTQAKLVGYFNVIKQGDKILLRKPLYRKDWVQTKNGNQIIENYEADELTVINKIWENGQFVQSIKHKRVVYYNYHWNGNSYDRYFYRSSDSLMSYDLSYKKYAHEIYTVKRYFKNGKFTFETALKFNGNIVPLEYLYANRPRENVTIGDLYFTNNISDQNALNGDMLATEKSIWDKTTKADYFILMAIESDPVEWTILGFGWDDGTEYMWDEEAAWYIDKSGNNWDNPGFLDITNAVGGMMSPFVQMAIDYVNGQDPLANLKHAYQNYNGTFIGFIYDGIKTSLSDFVDDVAYGGYRREKALWGAWVSFTSGGAMGSPYLKGINLFDIKNKVRRLVVKGAASLDDLVAWASQNGLSHLTRAELNDIFKFVDNNFDFAKRVAKSTKEIQSASTLTELASKLNLPITPTAKSLTPYQTRVWYSWRKAKIGDMINKKLSLENQAKQAVNLRNEIRSGARQAMKDSDIADYLDTKELNKTWEQLVQEKIDKGFTDDAIYQEIINSSMKGRPTVDNVFKIPTIK